MSISADVGKEIRAAQKVSVPFRVLLPWMAFCALVIWLFDRAGKLYLALPTLNCIAVLGFIGFVKRHLKSYPWFWVTMTIVAAFHALLVWYIPWTHKWVPAMAISAIDSMDFCLLLWVLSAVERLVGSKDVAAEEATSGTPHIREDRKRQSGSGGTEEEKSGANSQ